MKLNRTGSNWNELERNKINENWDIIEGGYNDVVGQITDEVVGHLIDSAKLIWKEPVETEADLPKDAEVGETRMVRESVDGVSHVYRYNGEKWELIQEIDVSLVNEVDRRLTAHLAEITEELARKANKEDVNSLASDKADKEYTYSELEKRATKEQLNNISVNQINKELGKLDASYMSEEFLEQMAGNTPIGSVPEDGSVTTKKTTFARKSKNLFDKDNLIFGKKFGVAGVIIDDDGFVLSQFIPVEGGRYVSRNLNSVIVQYDANKDYLQQSGYNAQSLYLLSTTRYIRISTSLDRKENLQVEYGETSTDYEEANKIIIDNLSVNENHLDNELKRKVNNGVSQITYKDINHLHQYPNKIHELLKEEYKTTTIACQLVEDESIKWNGNTLRVECDGSTTGQAIFIPELPISIEPSAGVGMWVFIRDVSSIRGIALDIYHNETLSPYWTRTENSFVSGWNLLRWDAGTSSLGAWTHVHRLRIRIINNGKTEVNIGSIFLEQRDKASLIIVNDGGRKSWKEIAYPELKARGIPTTWAINPNTFASHEDKMSEEEVLSLMYDLESSFSFHSWGSGTPTAQMSKRETREDALRCIRYLKSKGLASDYLWRAAVHQNLAPYHKVNNDLLLASATHTGKTGRQPLVFPFTDPYDIPRVVLHALDNDQMDSMFQSLKKTHGVIVGYTHGLYETGGTSADMTTDQFNYFLAKIDEGLDAGWLEGTTFEDLFGRIQNVYRGNVYEQLKDATRLK